MHTSQLRSVRREPALGACIPFDENLVLKPVNRYSFFLATPVYHRGSGVRHSRQRQLIRLHRLRFKVTRSHITSLVWAGSLDCELSVTLNL